MTENLDVDGYDPIGHYYNKKPEFDYAKFVELVKDDTKEYTIASILEELRVPSEVLEAFVDKALIGCHGEERDQICKKIMQINKPEWESIIKRLKFANLDFKERFSALEEKYRHTEENLLLALGKEEEFSLKQKALEETNDQLEKEVHTKGDEIARLMQEIQTIKSELSEKLIAETKELELSSNENRSLLDEIRNYQDKLSDLQADLDHKKNEIKELSLKIISLEESGSQSVIELEYEEADQGKKQKQKTAPIVVFSVLCIFVLLVSILYLLKTPKSSQAPSPVVAETQLAIPNPIAVPPVIAQQENTKVPAVVVSQSPVASSISHLVTPEAFRANVKNFKIVGQSLVIENETFASGATINGFKILSIEKTFVRLLDLGSNLQFRVDIGVVQ